MLNSITAILAVPFFLLVSILFLYRFTGKRMILSFDMVQFFYAFLVFPVLYVWLKTFLYFLLKHELDLVFSQSEWIAFDTVFSVIFLYFYAFGIIHSLTKTFSLQVERDPLFDLLSHSKYIHEFLSHIGIYVVGVFIVCLISVVNIFFPFLLQSSKGSMLQLTFLSILFGILVYIGVFIVTKIPTGPYKKTMRLAFGGAFLIHFLLFIIFDPEFSMSQVMFWFDFSMFSTVLCATFVHMPLRHIASVVPKYLTK